MLRTTADRNSGRPTAARIFLALALGGAPLALPAWAQDATPALPAGNNCTEGEAIDGSTADDARAKIEAAGYSDVVVTSKGCDNFWHATGIRDGMPVNLVLSPEGTVMTEGN